MSSNIAVLITRVLLKLARSSNTIMRGLQSILSHPSFFINFGGGGGYKALTMTRTPWNLTHGQRSKNLTMATDILESAPWSMAKMVIL